MTEIHENKRYIIDPVAFAAALIGAPILFTAATFWLAFIPVGALIVGGIPYLVIGCPVLLIHLRRHRADIADIMWVSFVSCTAAIALGTLVGLVQNDADPASILTLALITMTLGSIFSCAWGATFGWLYGALARDFYTQAETI